MTDDTSQPSTPTPEMPQPDSSPLSEPQPIPETDPPHTVRAESVNPTPQAETSTPVSVSVTVRGNGVAIAGGVLGIVGFVLGWIPFAGLFIGWPLGVLAIIFSSIGLSRTGNDPHLAGRGMAVAGLVLGIVTVVLKMIPGINLL